MQVLALRPAYDRPVARVSWRPSSSLSCCHGRHHPDGTDVCDGVVIKRSHLLSNTCAREQQCLLTADGQLFTVQRLFSVQLLGKAGCRSGSGGGGESIFLSLVSAQLLAGREPCAACLRTWKDACAVVLAVRTYASAVRCALHADGVVQCAAPGFKLRVCVPSPKIWPGSWLARVVPAWYPGFCPRDIKANQSGEFWKKILWCPLLTYLQLGRL